MIERTATCLCGALSAVCRGEPTRISVCHCLSCKQRSGSAFSWNATYPDSAVQTDGAAACFTHEGESGETNRRYFCPDCGTTVFYRIGMRPGMVSIPAGMFADPNFPPPTVEVYGERRCPWLAPVASEQE